MEKITFGCEMITPKKLVERGSGSEKGKLIARLDIKDFYANIFLENKKELEEIGAKTAVGYGFLR